MIDFIESINTFHSALFAFLRLEAADWVYMNVYWKDFEDFVRLSDQRLAQMLGWA